MSLFTWTQENSVKIIEIDEQHQKLFSIINGLYDLMSQNQTQDEILKIINELNNYADYHFKTEEKYFNQFNYEDSKNHILLHNSYKEKINKFIEDSKKETGLLISYDILDFLENWWMYHINNEDKKYTECFQSHGLK